MLMHKYDLTMDRPGNHFLAQMSHETTMRSLLGIDPSPEQAQIPPSIIAQDCVDEAAMESFPASDPPSYASVHA